MSIFGGGASKQAAADAAKARALQQISNDRQVAQTQAEEQRVSPSRKAPRGRRLFVTDFNSSLPSTFGGSAA